MSVYCTNSGNTYAGLAELAAAEAGLHVGDVVIELSGSNTGDVSFVAQDFDSITIKSALGEEFDPSSSSGAIHTGKITSTCPLVIESTRVYDIVVVYPTAQVLNSEFGGLANVGLTYGSTNNVYAFNCVIHDTYRGAYATAANPNATLENCTLYNNSNLGLLRCNCINTVVIDCAGTDYFSAVSQTNTWGDDASAQNLIAEGYATFVDFANGDVRIRSDSDVGLAGAGAFIQQVEASGFDINASFLSPAPVLSASLSSDTPEINLSASFSSPAPVFSASLAGDVPEFNLGASFVVPHVTSAVYLSAEIPEFDVSVSMTTPSVELSSSITTSVDDVDLSASFTVPSAVLGAVLINGDIIKITPTENIINSKPRSRMLFTKDRGRYL